MRLHLTRPRAPWSTSSQSQNNARRRLDKPGPGVAALGTFDCGGPSMVALGFIFTAIRRPEPSPPRCRSGEAWFQKRFPMPTEPGKSDWPRGDGGAFPSFALTVWFPALDSGEG